MTLAYEMEKLEYAHRLEKGRIWLDKCLLAVLIGLAGFIGNWIFEGYKSDLEKTQFLLQTRLGGAQRDPRCLPPCFWTASRSGKRARS